MRLLTAEYPYLLPSTISQDLILSWRKKLVNVSIKPVTWNNYNRHLKAIYSFAIKMELLDLKKNPFDGLFVREGKYQKKTFTKFQVSKIIYALDENITLPKILKPHWFISALIMTLRYTAMRRGQLLKLKIGNVNLDNKTIYIDPEINKNHDFHIIPISNQLYPYIEKLVAELKKKKQPDHAQLFNLNLFSETTRTKSQNMTQDQLSYIFRVISKHVNFTVSPHRFRHTAATQLMQNPENVYVTQKLLGHKDIKTTLSYIEHDVDMIREYVDML
ncbi:tyrosine-type recombinase/integrase [Exercitatus varius]|uniref:tyrosine-type recombinase/integrase n=1 Tax=Exercitatus varius TaxID=67857 RepID=UPI00294B70C1|nr:site-specific integrase [Exercitatus varius]MDG2961683.1 site-specific integrase [Exercitatus varius]